jgi:hypothetical protein
MTIVVGRQNPSDADEELLFLGFGWGGLHWRYRIGNNISDFASLDLVLGDTTRLAGVGLYQRTRASLELARAASCDEDVTILAIELFCGFHS